MKGDRGAQRKRNMPLAPHLDVCLRSCVCSVSRVLALSFDAGDVRAACGGGASLPGAAYSTNRVCRLRFVPGWLKRFHVVPEVACPRLRCPVTRKK
jgi:hypothetical protein